MTDASDAGTDSLIAVRGSTHGHYPTQAAVTQEIKRVFRAAPNWGDLTPVEADALEMMACKLGRILAGDPHFYDHWSDIAGYARLVDKECERPAG